MKIDFVITWVDDSDEEWLREKKNYLPETDTDPKRFRDWDLLKYWFRGVEKFAPWVNKIHFITWGHLPEFLNLEHPKLNIVKHEDYLKEEYLPTFNSNAIELSMHKIKDLSEHFVYFNDDTFLIKKTIPEDFFEKGLPKDVAILNPIVPKEYDSISNVMVNNIGLINKNFSFRQTFKKNWSKWFNLKYKRLLPLNFLFQPWSNVVGLYQQHLPSSFLKSTINSIWEKEYAHLNKTSLRKKRNNKKDINQWLFKEWLVMEGEFSPRNIDFGKYIMIKDLNDIKRFKKAQKKSATKIVCLNDHVEENFEEIVNGVRSEFEKILNEKSSYEI